MKKLTAIILAVLLLSGCQLASTEKNETIMGDKLVGVFVTFDPLDLAFDIEGYIRDNGVSDGEVITGGSEYEAVYTPSWGRRAGPSRDTRASSWASVGAATTGPASPPRASAARTPM